MDESLQVETVASHEGADSPALPSIGMFLSKMCTIPLICCNFEQIKKTVEQQTTQNKGEACTGDQTQEENTCTNISQDIAGIGIANEGNNQPETHTSARKQGSCLGPLIFLLFTNDLHKQIENCNTILFADDTTLYKTHRNLNYLNGAWRTT